MVELAAISFTYDFSGRRYAFFDARIESEKNYGTRRARMVMPGRLDVTSRVSGGISVFGRAYVT
jgi:hypothetical protein